MSAGPLRAIHLPGRLPLALGALASAAYAAWASGVSTFTDTSDIAVGAPAVLFLAVAICGWGRRRGAALHPLVRAPDVAPRSALPWLVCICVLVAIELASYLHPGPRVDYPTVSSGLDALFRHRVAKAAGWWVWLAACWAIVTS